jgi:hypothetical protein
MVSMLPASSGSRVPIRAINSHPVEIGGIVNHCSTSQSRVVQTRGGAVRAYSLLHPDYRPVLHLDSHHDRKVVRLYPEY